MAFQIDYRWNGNHTHEDQVIVRDVTHFNSRWRSLYTDYAGNWQDWGWRGRMTWR